MRGSIKINIIYQNTLKKILNYIRNNVKYKDSVITKGDEELYEE